MQVSQVTLLFLFFFSLKNSKLKCLAGLKNKAHFCLYLRHKILKGEQQNVASYVADATVTLPPVMPVYYNKYRLINTYINLH